ncbi:CAP domain-containing protein [Devosia sp. 1566]|uniref:CAP domain-containing protein n=1 Tax=Devosia sp. 1566 TaxID=2499144 RepID=UPI000FD7DDA6|nr:CAP domain-containing protein [Devosia sp. 1566]
MSAIRRRTAILLPTLGLLGAVLLSACSPFGNTAGSAGTLSPGLSARMDQPGASLDRAQAIGIINAYRATNGLPALALDTGLSGTAQALVNQYASTGTPPKTPNGVKALKLSAGYATFAETFSGWRNNPADAAGLRVPASKAGVAVAFNPTSNYGIYWVLILAD